MNEKKFPVLSQELKDAVNYEIREDLRYEAELILTMTTDENRKDFMKYHKQDNGNICCLVLDFAKRELVEQKKMIQNDNDGFGKFLE